MNKYYLEETEMVLNGMETAEAGRKLGLSHSTISLRVRKTLHSLNPVYEQEMDGKITVKEARLNKRYWLKLIADHKYRNRPEEQVKMEGRAWMAMLALIQGVTAKDGLPDEYRLRQCRKIAEDIAGM